MSSRSAPTIVVLHDGRHPPSMAQIESVATVRYAAESELPTALPGADALFVWHFLSDAIPHAWRRAQADLETLRWIHTASAGVDKLMFPELRDSQVVVTNSRGVFDRPIAEYVLGVVLAFAKDLPHSVRLQDTKSWRHRETERIEGKQALVIGTGPIGRAIARQLTAAGLDVTGAGRISRENDPDFVRVHVSTDLAEHYHGFDYVVLAAPLTEQTERMIDAAALSHFKPEARLINVGRGALLVQSDLVEALANGTIAAAALDVFDEEPLPPDSPLWTTDNVLISPHMSGDTFGWREDLVDLFARNLGLFRQNRQLENIVDKERGYVSG